MLGGSAGAVFGALPELAGILARERDDVFLREVTVDGVTLFNHFVRAERNCHVHTGELPLHPGAAVEPDIAGLGPRCALLVQLTECL